MVEEIKNDKKRTKSSKSKPQSIRLIFTALGIILLMVLSPWLYQITNAPTNPSFGTDPELNRQIIQVKTELITEMRSDIENYFLINSQNFDNNITRIQEELNILLQSHITSYYQPKVIDYFNDKFEAFVDDFVVAVTPVYLTLYDLDRYPITNKLADGSRLNVYSLDQYRDRFVPYSFKLTGKFYINIKRLTTNTDNSNNYMTSIEKIVHYNEVIDVPYLFFGYKLQQFQTQAESAYSDIARMVRYMLTTVARFRVHENPEFGSGRTHKNILNEGDLELALNLAILLEEVLLFRTYSYAAVRAIDDNFFDATDSDKPENPTGVRQWGNSELTNYYDYSNRKLRLTDPTERLLENLMGNYVTSGHIDPADIIALYLVFDEFGQPAIIRSPKDSIGILDEAYNTRYLLDPKLPNDPIDAGNLKIMPYLSPDGTNFNLKGNGAQDWFNEKIELQVNHEPKYLVNGLDFKVKGLDQPRGWYTTAQKRAGTRTRTQSVILEPPKDHDYRLEWDLQFSGQFYLELAQLKTIKRNDNSQISFSRTIDLDFPVKILVWFNGDPNIESIDFTNFNTGIATADGWVITSESHLVDYFEKEFWKYLKPFFTSSLDTIYAISQYLLSKKGMSLYKSGEKLYLDQSILDSNLYQNNWLTDILTFKSNSIKNILSQSRDNFWLRYDIFMKEYLLDFLDQYRDEYGFYNYTKEPQFPHPDFAPWIAQLGFDFYLLYTESTKVLNITVKHSNGFFTMFIHGLNDSSSKLEIDIRSKLVFNDHYSLTYTVSTRETGSKKPNIFADGRIYNRYRFITRAFDEPNRANINDISKITTNEHLLFSRGQFGALLKAGEIRLDELRFDSTADSEYTLELSIILPKTRSELFTELRELIRNINITEFAYENREDGFSNSVRISSLFRSVSDELINWLSKFNEYPKLALDISIYSPDASGISNITIYLNQAGSTMRFLNWLSGHAVDLVYAMLNEHYSILSISKELTEYLDKLSSEELNGIFFEIYNKKLDIDLLLENGNIERLNQYYSFSDSEKQNITLLTVLSGNAMQALSTYLEAGADEYPQKDTQVFSYTYLQMYYCLQYENSEAMRLALLAGTNVYLETNRK